MTADAFAVALKSTARTFYLSVKLLPPQLQQAVGLAYLLARTSDTVADAVKVATAARLSALKRFRECVADSSDFTKWDAGLIAAAANPAERDLLTRTAAVLTAAQALPAAEWRLIQAVLAEIIDGQIFDLDYFSAAAGRRVALADSAQLDKYAWQVAGCVGEFWTRLCALKFGFGFAKQTSETMIALGIKYGKGLQLVNILRDVAADLRLGRCYLPLANPYDEDELNAAYDHWLQTATDYVNCGFNYAGSIKSRRLYAASILPALLARKTISLLRQNPQLRLVRKIKISKAAVLAATARALLRL